MTSWHDFKKDWVLLLEAGFIAVNQADEDSALKLFKAAELLKPDNALPKVGFGYLHLHKLELKQACKMFEEALEIEPANDMAKALLGISMSMAPTSLEKGEKILEQTLKSHDPLIKSLSTTALDFVDQFLKKAPSPIEGPRKRS
jgi:tetratricopeptide (TPR) repeat protein